jgi:hypothetical protein
MNCGKCGGVVIGGVCQYCKIATNPATNKLVVDEFVFVGVLTGIISSIAANYIYDKWRNKNVR